MDLNSMKYAELRSFAKELGLKANGKADKLLRAIKQHFEEMDKLKAEQEQDGGKVQEADKKQVSEDSAAVCKEEDSDINVFVTKRRGRENASKRKLTDAAAACDANMTSKGKGKVNGQSRPRSSQGRKKRKLSPDEGSERTGPEPQQSGSDQQPSDSKDEEPARCETGTETGIKVVKGGRIPRYQRLLQNKTSTPNFKKIHEAQFDKMESISTYVQRKSKQAEANKHPVQQVKKMNPPRASMFSPDPPNKQPAEGKNRQTLPNKPAGKKDAPFGLSVHLTRRINVRFSAATCDNEFKGSLVKTPARMSPYLGSCTPQGRAAEPGKGLSVRTSNFSAQKPSGPFIFTGNTSASATPGTQKKMTFDLKSSLSRPLTYKPHKGKLKPFGEVKENMSANKSLVSNPRQQTYKQHKVQTREDRRTKRTEERRQKKESLLGARRGLVMK
ncbi:nucleolar and spindle-associated protein 1 [Nematolebias whitei]|uniref:nucleolar and spindle-associated protein 1 n=1 Tax=Nematolebias whitei TaxID=451745 RepID=UPI00189BDFD6|nr:nucleolar and spindle-associated protein 1 [Nematolebias whitei]